MPRTKVCNVPGCPEIGAWERGRCPTHEKAADLKRGTPTARGYGRAHRLRFREGVLAKHPVCQLCRRAPSTVADHYPKDRRQLVALGLDANDPQHGRGLCKPCHDRETAKYQPGGWNLR